MPEADPAPPVQTTRGIGGEMALRVVSSLVLAPLAIVAAYVGGWLLGAFWGVAAILVFWEWTGLVMRGGDLRALRVVGVVLIAVAVILVTAGGHAAGEPRAYFLACAFAAIVIGIFASAALAPRTQRLWVACGMPYAGTIAVAPLVLRADVGFGFMALLFVFEVVWATDILAYFVGRAIGGPKIAPRISPKKTWSGAIGGTLAAVAGAMVIAWSTGLPSIDKIVLLAVALSAAAQAGDFFESALKRQFGAKDSSHLIPGHGGLMDRLDGFVVATALALVIGTVRGGLDEPARGLLVW